MNGVLHLGPAVIAVERAVAVALVWAFLAAASHRSFGTNGSRAAWTAAALGIVAARVGYVVENLPAFRADPASALYLWQGGFSPGLGIAAAAAALVLLQSSRFRVRSLGLLAALGSIGLVAQIVTAERDIIPFPGKIALADLEGKLHRLPGRPGEPFVVNLWATWCPPCRREMPMLAEVAASSPLPILMVNQGEDRARVSAFAAEFRLSDDRLLLDRNAELSKLADGALPATIFVGADGAIRSVHFGEISRAALLGGIDDLLENQK